MGRAVVLVVFVIISLQLSLTASGSRKEPMGKQTLASSPPTQPSVWASAFPDTFFLAEYTFDDSLGGPDPQGWVGVDRTLQSGPYFHIDDFAGISGNYVPLEGSKSLWCGVRDLPGCVSCPGYGNLWFQMFESVAFPVSGDVTVDFLIRYDTEPVYDFVFLEYESQSGEWQTLLTFDWAGEETARAIVPGDSLNGSVKLRFKFESEQSWSDEDGGWPTDGAVVIDSVTVSDSTGIVDFQDFEVEAVGALFTTDGDWVATVEPGFGDYAALFPGASVLQEDTLVVNTTHLWGFFSGSPDTYACGGHPGQLAVPFTRNPGSSKLYDYFNNEIRSPLIDLSRDIDGVPIPEGEMGGLVVECDVYMDLPLDNLIFFVQRVRFFVDGVPTPWTLYSVFPPTVGAKQWSRWSQDSSEDMPPGATHVQAAIGAIDLCYWHCGYVGTGACHSHSPLIDNVLVFRTAGGPLSVTNTNDAGPGSLRQALLDADDPDRDLVVFDIPGPGPHVIQLAERLSAGYPIVLDGTTQPGYAGTPLIVIDGNAPTLNIVGMKVSGSNSAIRGLKFTNCGRDGLYLVGADHTVVEGCQFVGNGQSGIRFDNTYDCIIGGDTPDKGNQIWNNGGDGIQMVLGNGGRNAFLSNSIYDNARLGIDLRLDTGDIGVTPNDHQDSDAGPNMLQNFPVVRWADSNTSLIGASLNTISNSTFTVKFFSNTACDPSGYGEGHTYIGSAVVTTGAQGNVDFTYTTTVEFDDGDYLTGTATDGAGNTSEFSACFLVSPGTGADSETTPKKFALRQNFPNPFNPTTVILYEVPEGGGHVTLRIYDVGGRLVRTLIDGEQTPGEKRVTWHGRNEKGHNVATGVYFYRMTAPGFEKTRKMVLLQ
jgi:hypothetical protein